jgi:hypothetical protein
MFTEGSGLVFPPLKAGSIWSARPAAFSWRDLGGDHAPWDRLAALQRSGPRRGHDDAEPATTDIPAVDANIYSTAKLIAAQSAQVLVMHDASDGSQMGSCSREPPRGTQDLGRGEDTHHHSMDTYDAG